MHGTDFYFNGEYSVDKGIYLVRLESGLVQEPFLAERELISEQIAGNPIPYVYNKKDSPLRLKLTFTTLDNEWTLEKRREIARWFDTDDFEEFYSEDNIEKRYYLRYISGIDIHTTGSLNGYIITEFINISPYAYSPIYIQTNDFSTITDTTNFQFINSGDMDLYPELEIYKVGSGDISIINLTDNGTEFKFTGLADGETVYIDNQNHDIITDLPYTYRYDNFNGNYLCMKRGINNLTISGKCILNFRSQFVIKG